MGKTGRDRSPVLLPFPFCSAIRSCLSCHPVRPSRRPSRLFWSISFHPAPPGGILSGPAVVLLGDLPDDLKDDLPGDLPDDAPVGMPGARVCACRPDRVSWAAFLGARCGARRGKDVPLAGFCEGLVIF